MPSAIVKECSELLKDENLKISFVESATAGRICYEFSLTEHAGKFLKGSLVCYDADVKQDQLQVQRSLIDTYTPESAEVTEALTEGAKTIVPSDIYVSVTGLTTPGGSETEEKPVGTMFIHGRFKDKVFTDRTVFPGGPDEIVMQTVDRVAFLIIRAIKSA
ncbi:CinA family protein [Pedobacter immunditicola]|uniref:CinA family protein n=1 Tax=Pedobacter immunditicola TaxID=3133440 RepID=UPI0030ADE70A